MRIRFDRHLSQCLIERRQIRSPTPPESIHDPSHHRVSADVPEREILLVPASREDRSVILVLSRDHNQFRVSPGVPNDTRAGTSGGSLIACLSTLPGCWSVHGETSAIRRKWYELTVGLGVARRLIYDITGEVRQSERREGRGVMKRYSNGPPHSLSQSCLVVTNHSILSFFPLDKNHRSSPPHPTTAFPVDGLMMTIPAPGMNSVT